MKIMLAGDVMLGRGIDQVLSFPCPPELRERYVDSALTYVELAEKHCGTIPRPVSSDYPWGDALPALERASPAARIINLETAITRRGRPEPKGINYRMAPEHVRCLEEAAIDCCVLANNHVLDWGREGLCDTLEALDGAGIARAGAGRDAEEALAPAVLSLGAGQRLLVYGAACASSGVSPHWAAEGSRHGVAFLPDLGEATARKIAERIAADRSAGDLVVWSVHWGRNWGFGLEAERRFAHWLIDAGGVDVVHGHSSHHPKGLERYRDRLILYGCGDLLNDYEGIGGYEAFRPELVLVYLPQFDTEGPCSALELLPFRIARFRLDSASRADAQWLADRLGQASPAACTVDLVDAPYGLSGVMALSVSFGD